MLFAVDFFARRLLQGFVIVLFIALLIFTLLRVVPGDPVRLMLGPMVSQSVLEETAQEMGLRDPIAVQFVRYFSGVMQGDFGHSFVRNVQGGSTGGSRGEATFSDSNRAPVIGLITAALPYSLLLAGLTFLFALVVAVPIGIYAGLRADQWPDRLALYLSSALISLPNVWLGLVLIFLVSAKAGLLPAIGYEDWTYAILPAIVLSVELIPIFIRSLSVAVSVNMLEPYVEIGQIRGLSRLRMISGHVLRNAYIPFLNAIGIQAVALLLGGLFVVEYVFNYPGLGSLMINAVFQRDFPLIQAIAILSSVVLVGLNIVVDFISTMIDRRLQY